MRFLVKIVLFIAIFSCTNEVKKTPQLLSSVPQNTLAIVQFNDQNMLENALKSTPLLNQIFALNSELYNTTLNLLTDEIPSKALLCFAIEGKSSIEASFLFKTTLQDSIQLPQGEVFEYDQTKVVVNELNNEKIYHTLIKGIMIRSTSKLLIENSIRSLQKNRLGIQEEELFELAKISDDNAPLSLYIKKGFDQIVSGYFPNTPLFPFLGSSWFSFDFNTKRDPFTLDGVSFINDSIPDKLALIKGQEAHRLLTPQVVPQNFDSYFGLAIADYKLLEEQFKSYSRYFNIPLNQINFSSLSVIDEIGWLQLKEQKTIILHLNHTETIPVQLFSEGQAKGSYRGIKLYDHQLPKDFELFLQQLGSYENLKWVCKLDDFLIYSDTETRLKQLIGNYLDNATLTNNLEFKTLRDELADNSTFLWLGQTQNLKNRWGADSKKDAQLWDKIALKNYPLAVLQGVAENSFIQTRFTAQKKNTSPQKNSVVSQYSFSLDAPAGRAPQWIKNHRNKTMDLVVQDQENVLYLFSNTGKLFWKKQLDGPIIGSITQVDLYRNKRLQMVFRTKNRFQILDRNGKVVPPFDLKLSGNAPQHLAVFDYDLNRNYRFLLADGKQLQMYNSQGKKVNGFKLKKLKSPLANTPKHIRFGGKDYIVLQFNGGNIRLLNRQGSDRIRLNEKINASNNQVYAYRNTFAGTTQKGALFQIDSKGNILKSDLSLGPGHQIDMSAKSIVSIDENKLEIKGIPVILPYGKYTAPKIHYLNNTLYFLFTDLDTQKVYAYLSNGNLVGGFPIYGAGPADLINADNDPALELVVQSEQNGFLIYELN